MYAGPGAGSLCVAAWQLRRLAHSTDMTAESLSNTLGELNENWKGSSSDLMADAAGRYLKWLSKHSIQIVRTAYAIESVVRAYEATRHRVVPPEVIASNREEVDRLIASNVAGENAPAIAGLERRYQQYRAENIQAMDRYLRWTGNKLSDLPRWQGPPQIHRGRGG